MESSISIGNKCCSSERAVVFNKKMAICCVAADGTKYRVSMTRVPLVFTY